MRKIDVRKIKKTVAKLCIEANINLRGRILSDLKKAVESERNSGARKILRILIKNAIIARHEGLAICQDTGMACVYLEVGQDVRLRGGNLEKAVNDGVRAGYKKGYFRNSIVDPITRRNTGDGAPAVINTRIVKGVKVKITVVPKGFGCENKNQIRMFKPTAAWGEIKGFIIDVVKEAGPDACPPYLIGVGIGGTFEKAAELSKEAMLKKVTSHKSVRSEAEPPRRGQVTSQVVKLKKDLLKKINKLNIGPAGMGGKTTALAVDILTYPTHIAGLPVAVSIGCHAMRSATKVV